MRAHSYSASDAGTIRTARPPCGCQSDRPRALHPPQTLILRPPRGNLPALHRSRARCPRQWVGQGHVAPSRTFPPPPRRPYPSRYDTSHRGGRPIQDADGPFHRREPAVYHPIEQSAPPPRRGGPGAWPCAASSRRMHRCGRSQHMHRRAAASGADRVDHAPLHEYPLCQLKYGTAAATRRPTSWYCADTHLLETTRQHQLPIRIATSLLAPRRSLGAGDAAWRRRTRGRGRWRARYADGSAPAGARRP